jgi:RNA polymerase sigma factor (sigma-70 family)
MKRMGPPGPPPPASFETFYRSTASRVLRAVQRIAGGDCHLAQDATQEAFCHMLGKWPERESMPLDANRKYALGIATHKVMDGYRRRRKLTELDDDFDEGTEDSGIEAVLDRHSVFRTVRELIFRQPPRRRAVAVLFFIEELSYAEVAAVLGMETSTARTHVERLRATLKPALDRFNQAHEEGEGR